MWRYMGAAVHGYSRFRQGRPTWICVVMGAVVMSTPGVQTSGEQVWVKAWPGVGQQF